ncbi:MAG: hypothetical protein HLUCCO16_17795 [Phormidium sp. OSCR]|nr:MAG: hypothetical protein HLUCCO16_17795 [Phormidium sp. OSCR]
MIQINHSPPNGEEISTSETAKISANPSPQAKNEQNH